MHQYRTDYSHNEKNTGKRAYVYFFQKKSNWFAKDANLQNCQERFLVFEITGYILICPLDSFGDALKN